MENLIISIKDDFIKLGQALKLANLAADGVQAKIAINDGLVKVNDEIEFRRGRKIKAGDQIYFKNTKITVVGKE